MKFLKSGHFWLIHILFLLHKGQRKIIISHLDNLIYPPASEASSEIYFIILQSYQQYQSYIFLKLVLNQSCFYYKMQTDSFTYTSLNRSTSVRLACRENKVLYFKPKIKGLKLHTTSTCFTQFLIAVSNP